MLLGLCWRGLRKRRRDSAPEAIEKDGNSPSRVMDELKEESPCGALVEVPARRVMSEVE
jgi:hypothetical protein